MTPILVFPVPAAINGRGLAEELAAAGIQTGRRDVWVSGDELRIRTDADRPAVAAVVAAHTGQPSHVDAAEMQRRSDADDALAALIAQAGGAGAVRTELKAVLAGNDAFTPAQMQRLLAALALSALRDRIDS